MIAIKLKEKQSMNKVSWKECWLNPSDGEHEIHPCTCSKLVTPYLICYFFHFPFYQMSTFIVCKTESKGAWVSSWFDVTSYFVCMFKAAKYEIQKPSTCRATLFRCKFRVDVSRFSPCEINLLRNRNICCGLKKVVAKSRAQVYTEQQILALLVFH